MENIYEILYIIKFMTKKDSSKLIIKVNPQMRKKFLQVKLKIGWLICNLDDYLLADSVEVKRHVQFAQSIHKMKECLKKIQKEH